MKLFCLIVGGLLVFHSETSQAKTIPSVPIQSKIVYESETLQAAVLSGDWLTIGRNAGKIANLKPGDLFPVRVRQTFDLGLGKALGSAYLGKKALNLLLSFYTPYILPAEREMLTGVAEGFQVSPGFMHQAFMTVEILNYLVIKVSTLSRFVSACSSFISPDREGKMIFAHTMDFMGAGSFDKNLAVYLLKPFKKHRILAVSPRGVPLAGLSAMNDAGLTLALHTSLHQNLAGRGVAPLLSVNREVLEDASNIEEALAIYAKYRYMTGWLVQIADKKRSGMLEFSGDGVRFIPANHRGISVLSNHYSTKFNLPREFHLSKGVDIHNHDRSKRLRFLTRQEIPGTQGTEALQRAFAILSDSYSPYSKRKVIFSPSAIRAVDQVFSVVFEPSEGSLWVADNALTPASLGATYVKFSFENMEKNEFKYEALENKYSELAENLKPEEKIRAAEALNEFTLASTPANKFFPMLGRNS